MELQPEFAVFVPILVAMLGILKGTGFPARYIPVLSVLSGLAIGFGVISNDVTNSLITGFLIGLSAVGTHSGIKNTMKK
jgi:surface polysaccharide O-acyltransferase-like enzyme